jgi:hypothetical protein
MSEPTPARPVPGPPRSGPTVEEPPADAATSSAAGSFDDLAQRPVAEHVGVFDAEHARLQRELGTIDQV